MRLLLAAAALLAAVAAWLRIRSYDLWWHLEAGEWIARFRSIPRADDFSFTSRGAPWIDHEWLSQLLLEGAHRLFGLDGLLALKALCAFGVLAAGAAACRARPGAALALISIVAVGMRPRLAERPETISLLMAALMASVIMSLASHPAGSRRRLGWLAALTILWCNLHAGALLAPALCAAAAAGCWLDFKRSGGAGSTTAVKTLLSATGISFAALMVNPYGVKLYGLPLTLASSLAPANLINPEWLPPTMTEFPLFYLVSAAAVAFGVAGLCRKVPLSGARLAPLVMAGALGMTSVRHIGLYFALLPVLAGSAWLPAQWDRRALGGAACLTAIAWLVVMPPPGSSLGRGIQPERFPVETADFLDASLTGARLYNDAAFGGYLLWRGYPGRRVFLDGRNEVHARLLSELSAALDDGRKWKDLLARHEVEGAVVRYRPETVTVRDAVTGQLSRSTWSETHFPLSEWALVHWDPVAMVFARRNGKYAPPAATSEYLSLRPEAFRLGLRGHWPGSEAGAPLEVARRLAENPGCPLAKEMARVYGSGRPAGR